MKEDISNEILDKSRARWDLETKNPNYQRDRINDIGKDIVTTGILIKSGEICFTAATDVVYREKLR
jgi:hypothetical protein